MKRFLLVLTCMAMLIATGCPKADSGTAKPKVDMKQLQPDQSSKTQTAPPG